MNPSEIFNDRVLALPVLLFSIVIHEFSHALVAYRAGDDTAARQGRLTLNPLAHIDPIGTVLIPIIQFFGPSGLPLIGWAKPVPVNPLRFRSSEWDIFVSLAGPASNFLLVLVAAILLKLMVLLGAVHHARVLGLVLLYFIDINVMLGIFNLIPIPPLDGSHVLHRFLVAARSPWAERYAALGQYGYIILLLILISPASKVFGWIIGFCENLVLRYIL